VVGGLRGDPPGSRAAATTADDDATALQSTAKTPGR